MTPRTIPVRLPSTIRIVAAAALLFASVCVAQDASSEPARRQALAFTVPVVEVTAKGNGTTTADAFRVAFRLRFDSSPLVASIDDQAVMTIANLERRLSAVGVEFAMDRSEPGGFPLLEQSAVRAPDGRLVDVRTAGLWLKPVPTDRIESVLREIFATSGYIPMSLSVQGDHRTESAVLKERATQDAVVKARAEAAVLARGAAMSLGRLVYLRADGFSSGTADQWSDREARRRLSAIPAEVERQLEEQQFPRRLRGTPDSAEFDWENPDAWPKVDAARLAGEVAKELREADGHLSGRVEITAAFELLPAAD